MEAAEQVRPLTPCCPFWQHRGGQVHDSGLPSPAAFLRDAYRLDGGGRAGSGEIVRRYHDRSAA